MKRTILRSILIVLFSMAGTFALAAEPKSSTAAAVQMSLKEKIAKGKTIYLSKCISCHNSDPHKNGSVGPAISGSSLALITARVMEAKYPKDYTPKRKTHLMKPLPGLKNSLEFIHAFLNQTP